MMTMKVATTVSGLLALASCSSALGPSADTTEGFFMSGDTRLSYSHAPPANALAALPGVLSGYRPDLTSHEGWRRSFVTPLSAHFAFGEDYRAFRTALVKGRRVMACFLPLLFLYLWWRLRS